MNVVAVPLSRQRSAASVERAFSFAHCYHSAAMPKIASRISVLTGEGALAVFTRAKELEKEGRSIIHLELGEPDFHAAAPVVDAVRAAVAEGRDRYVATRGIPPLRAAIAEYLQRTRKLEVAPEQVLVAPGCKMALSLAMMALIEPGDEALYPDPSFPIYPSFTRGLGAKAVPYALGEKNQFQPDIREISSKITPKTRVLIFNSPNNPTGTVFSEKTIAQIAELAGKHDLWIIADEIYARILFTGEYKSIWALPGMAERTVIIDGLKDSTNAVPAMVAEYRKRRDVFVEKLNKIPGFHCQSPDGAFYAWVNIEQTGRSAEEVQKILLEEVGVAAIAGAAFGAEGKNYVRFSLVSATHLLEEALDRIERATMLWRAVESR